MREPATPLQKFTFSQILSVLTFVTSLGTVVAVTLAIGRKDERLENAAAGVVELRATTTSHTTSIATLVNQAVSTEKRLDRVETSIDNLRK